MRASVTARYVELLFGVQEPEVYNPVDALGAKLVSMVWAPWEGGLAPDNVSARAQNPAVTTGTVLTTLTEWSGNSDHYNNVFATGVTWTTNRINGMPAFVCASQSYSQSSPFALGANTTIIFVYNNNSGATGFLYQGSTQPQLLARNTGTIEWYDTAGSASTTLVANTTHVVSRYISATDTISRLDGLQIDAEGSVHDYGAAGITRWLSSASGSSRLGGDMMGWLAIQDITEAELLDVEAWCADQGAVVLAGQGYTIDTPIELTTYQRISTGNGEIRANGTYDPAVVFSLDARHNGGAWSPCTLAGGNWTIDLAATEATGNFDVRVNATASLQTVPNVSVGRVVAGIGQSNMFGSSENKFNNSANTSIAIYDPRPLPQSLMVARSTRDTWGAAYDEGWIPDYLQTRNTNDSVPWGMVRFAIGSTRIAFWEPTAAVDAAGLGYTVQYYGEFIRAVIAAQGYDPVTYDPLTDNPVCEEVFIQIGESDARFGTTKAAFKASLSAIAAQIKTDLGASVNVRISVLQDLFTTGYVDTFAKLQAIQDAVTETVTEDANVSAGPDFSDVVLAKSPPEINGNVHFYLDAEVALAAARWAVFPT